MACESHLQIVMKKLAWLDSVCNDIITKSYQFVILNNQFLVTEYVAIAVRDRGCSHSANRLEFSLWGSAKTPLP